MSRLTRCGWWLRLIAPRLVLQPILMRPIRRASIARLPCARYALHIANGGDPLDFEILILLILISTHLIAFGIGWMLRHINLRETQARHF